MKQIIIILLTIMVGCKEQPQTPPPAPIIILDTVVKEVDDTVFPVSTFGLKVLEEYDSIQRQNGAEH